MERQKELEKEHRQEERERKSKGKVLVSGTHGSIPSVSGLILHKFFRAGQVRDLDTHRHTHRYTQIHTDTHTQTHTEPGKSLYHWLPLVS